MGRDYDMIKSLWNAEAGMQASWHMLQTTAHNISNVNTDGYRSRESRFSETLYRSMVQVNPQTVHQPGPGGWEFMPVRTERGSGVLAEEASVSGRGGPLRHTDRSTDMAVVGDGYLPVGDADGQLTGYTRKGEFHFDADGLLVHVSGNYLLDANSEPIQRPGAAGDAVITPDGQVTSPEGESGDGETVTRLLLAVPQEGQRVVPLGSDIYGMADADDQLMAGREVAPGEEGGQIRQGYLEASNVDLALEMVNMMMAQRGFQLNGRTLQAADEMYDLANNMHR